ncbi:hypothetical protein Pfo_011293 [Paulownia fortunei]|nr:hypothetical protein Pfo_011293 [Paulownia fortunei]
MCLFLTFLLGFCQESTKPILCFACWQKYAIDGRQNQTTLSQDNRFVAPDNQSAIEVAMADYTPDSV